MTGIAAGHMGPFTLSVTPDVWLGSTVRAFSAAVGKEAALGDERFEDLKLLLSEIHAHATEAVALAPSRLRIEIAASTDGLSVRCEGAGSAPQGEEDPGGLRARLLEALAPDLRWSAGGVVSFSVPR